MNYFNLNITPRSQWKKIRVFFIVFISIWYSQVSYSQVPEIKTPVPASIKSNVVVGNGITRTIPNSHSYTPPSPNDYTKMIMMEVEQNEAKRNEQALLDQYYRELNAPGIQYSFPTLNHPSQSAFHSAFNELKDMIEGKREIDLKRAVFVSENAYLNNSMSYEDYLKTIEKMVTICSIKHQQDGFSMDNQIAKMHTLHQFVSDTFEIDLVGQERKYTHYPMKYDFEDFRGEENWTKLFVSKLIIENTGQCHSMPLLFMILAQEFDTEAYLAFAPSHSYIKFPDNNGNWHNLELTNGMLTSDAFIVESGYIKAEALMNKIYMDTISVKQTVAFCMVDMVKGYIKKYGYDNFVLDVAEYALEQNNEDVFARMIKANYHTALSMYVVQQMGYPSLDSVLLDPKAKEIFEARNFSYDELERVGYEEMPKPVYEKWLHSLEEEKAKQQHQDNFMKLKNSFY